MNTSRLRDMLRCRSSCIFGARTRVKRELTPEQPAQKGLRIR